jgi:predicted metal-dependent hydrolase
MSEEPLPPYTYTPGVTPHPISDPAGHSYGHRPDAVTLDAKRLFESPPFRRGVQLFRNGYYWEAHEEWESVWHAVGRRGADADLLKGLIRLAAAGVKAREGNSDGVMRHARRAAELLTSARQATVQDPSIELRILVTLAHQASGLAESATTYAPLDHGRPVVFWPELAGELDRL